MMKRQVDQMTRLIDDLLEVARIRRGKFQLRTAPRRPGRPSSPKPSIPTNPLAELGGHRLTLSLPREPLSAEGDADAAVANLRQRAA